MAPKPTQRGVGSERGSGEWLAASEKAAASRRTPKLQKARFKKRALQEKLTGVGDAGRSDDFDVGGILRDGIRR
jgi:hypothetical protein